MGHRACWCLWGKRPSERGVLRGFLKVATEIAEWTDSWRLFQGEGAREQNTLAPAYVLTLGAESDSFV